MRLDIIFNKDISDNLLFNIVAPCMLLELIKDKCKLCTYCFPVYLCSFMTDVIAVGDKCYVKTRHCGRRKKETVFSVEESCCDKIVLYYKEF